MATAKKLIDQAIELSDAGKYRKAHDLLTKAIKLDGSIAQAYFERAISLMGMDRDRDALPDLDRCLELDPAYPGARDWRARALSSTGSLQLAAEERLRSLREHPNGPYPRMGVCPQEWADCAEAFAKAGDTARAVALLEEYLSKYARKVTAYASFETAPLRLLARLLLQAGEADRAATLARTAYSNIKHRCPMDFVVYALALEAVGDKQEALKVAEEALRENDQMEEAIALKRRLSRNSGRRKR
jgi:tetratricopeptide (TPR) repeat protein